MRRRPVTTLFIAIILILAAVMAYFYLVEGSMEGAGARMDDTLSEAGDVAIETVRDVGEATEELVEDIADGPDDEN